MCRRQVGLWNYSRPGQSVSPDSTTSSGEEDAAIADGIAAVLDLAGEAAHAGSNDSDDREDQEGPEENGTDVCEVDFVFASF